MSELSPETFTELDAQKLPERSRVAKIGRLLLHPIKTARTAPLGSSFVALGVASSALFMPDFVNHPAVLEGVDVGMFGPYIFYGGKLVSKQFKLRGRIEHNLSENGYDERFFEPLTDEWCARQTVHATLGNDPLLEQYKDLCQRQVETARLSWLPHI